MSDEKKKSGCLAQIILFVFVMGLVGWLSYSTDQQKKNETPEIRREAKCGKEGKFSAGYMAEKFVRDRLKAPSTAKFPWYEESSVTISGECEFVIRSYVDAQNSYGAMLRSDYVVKLEYDPVENVYTAQNIQIGQ